MAIGCRKRWNMCFWAFLHLNLAWKSLPKVLQWMPTLICVVDGIFWISSSSSLGKNFWACRFVPAKLQYVVRFGLHVRDGTCFSFGCFLVLLFVWNIARNNYVDASCCEFVLWFRFSVVLTKTCANFSHVNWLRVLLRTLKHLRLWVCPTNCSLLYLGFDYSLSPAVLLLRFRLPMFNDPDFVITIKSIANEW